MTKWSVEWIVMILRMKDSLSNFKNINYRVILVYALCMFYIGLLSRDVLSGPAEIHFGDYISYWTVGRIADTLGYSKIYDLTLLQRLQYLTLQSTEVYASVSQSEVIAMPVPYFSFFIIPFQYLSRINIDTSYWLWLVLNIIALIGYVIYFHRQINPLYDVGRRQIFYLLLILLSFSVYLNTSSGQINILLLIFIGEFIRNLKGNNKISAGIWLSGLILKPQMLILIVPIILLKRWWKVFIGFLSGFVVILFISFLLSGVSGFQDLLSLYTTWGVGNFINSPMGMVNWRMIGEYINLLTENTTLGLVISLIGIAFTLGAVYTFTKGLSNGRDLDWDISMMGIMFATIVISWHSHLHMTIVMIPLLMINLYNRVLPEKMLLLWSILIPLIWIITSTIDTALGPSFDQNLFNLPSFSRAFTGFFVNLIFIIWSYRKLRQQAISKIA